MEDKNRIILFRVLAYVIDGIIIGLFNFVLASFMYVGSAWFDAIHDTFIAAYYIYFHAKFGQTPGKMILTIKVFDYKTNVPITLKQSVVRYSIWIAVALCEYILKAVSGDIDATGWMMAIPGLVALVLLLSVFADEQGRGLHDKLAGTVVKDVFVRKAEV